MGSAIVRSDDVIANRYRLIELIGHGGMGIVWRAEDQREHRQVALKRPHGGDSVRADLEREADIARRVAYPGAVEVYEVAGDGDDSWLVMEYSPPAASPRPARCRHTRSPRSVRRSRPRSRPRTPPTWCTATSRRATCWSARTGPRR